MKVLVYSTHPHDRSSLHPVRGEHEFTFVEKPLSSDTAQLAEGFDGVSLFTVDDASAPVLKKLKDGGVRFVLLRSAGFDHVDIKKASSLGMRVANVPDYSPYSIAEHAVALLMAANRKIVEGQQLMQLRDFRIDTLRGIDIHGKTVGVIGTGKIGIAFARIMLGFGARVVATDPVVNPEATDAGIKYLPLESLLRISDVVSIHCPLNSSTRHLISQQQLGWMKADATLINTARGAIINSLDLIKSLEEGKFRSVCLDVYEHEKGLFFEDHRSDIIQDSIFTRLRSFKNVLITSHQAFFTEEAIAQIAATTIANLDCFATQAPCRNKLTDNIALNKIPVNMSHPNVIPK